jgi:hypothetical protein
MQAHGCPFASKNKWEVLICNQFANRLNDEWDWPVYVPYNWYKNYNMSPNIVKLYLNVEIFYSAY